jgi:16S rRNA (guanine966-N2)-methyltransferase
MRVIAGTARGRRLKAPPGRTTRPTSDRVREALFSSLRDDTAGARILDLFAGTGAVGIEALSRGADHAVFVENDPGALAVIKDNLAAAGVADRATVVRATAAAFTASPRGGPFTIVYCDPPYAHGLDGLLGLLADLRPHLAPNATVVIERERRDPELAALNDSAVLAVDRQRSYGDTILVYLRTKEA